MLDDQHPPRSTFKVWAVRLALGLAVLIVLAAVGLYAWLMTSLPKLDGEVWVRGPSAEVKILRDENGVPIIQARSQRDAYFALGFAHAQDRMWQMERMRRLGAGRLAEVLGPDALKIDKLMRTLGLYRLSEATVDELDDEVRAAVDAYASGVNAWLTTHEGALPPEFVVLGLTPEPWKPADSLVWGRLMGLRLAGNWQTELLRARLLAKDLISPELLAQLWPEDEVILPPALADADQAAALDGLLAEMPKDVQPTLASNIWAVAPSRTDTGGALLASDPHLGFDAPILWYLARIDAPDLQIAGVTMPGVPFHLMGHNGHIAWGMTTTASDTQDLFMERVVGDGTTYAAPGGPRAFSVRTEVIQVRGEPPVTIQVRASRHGPVVSDLADAYPLEKDQVMALAATSLVPRNLTAQAIYRINHALDWPDFVQALRDFHGPQQNVMYADTDGNIGFYAPALVPIRKAGDGSLPAPGWDGSHDWTDWVPFELLPHAFNPPDGLLVNANNRITPPGYPYLLTKHWPETYRAERIRQVLGGHDRHVPLSLSAIQMDNVSLMARQLKPLLLDFEPGSNPVRARQASDMLSTWDGSMDRRMAEPLIFNAWVREAEAVIFADEMGPELFDRWRGLHPRALIDALRANRHWCDDINTSRREGCRDQLGLALDRALDWITERQGTDMRRWQWGKAHRAVFEHTLFRYIPVLGRLTELGIETDGADFTVNRGEYRVKGGRGDTAPYEHIHGAGYRAVYSMVDPFGSRFVIATGQSGNPLSPYYDNFLETWRNGQTVRIRPEGTHRLRLIPLP